MKGPAHHGTRAKHASHKHAGTSKHTSAGPRHKTRRHHAAPVAVGKAASHPKPRKFTPDGSVALCSARAVAESLRLSLGIVVSDEDVLDLYWRTAADPDAGASILATLETAAGYGLDGYRPERFAEHRLDQPSLPFGQRLGLFETPDLGEVDHNLGHAPVVHDLILGLQLPAGPHAVLAIGDVWWSWGEPYAPASFPGAVIEEAWAVTWQ